MKNFQLLFIIGLVYIYNAHATLDITIKTYEMCKETGDTPMKYWATFKKINSTVSLVDSKVHLPYDIGEDVTIDTIIEMYKNDEWSQIVNITRRDPCPLLNKYGGEVLFELERHFNVTPGVCPLPKGDYEIKDYVVNFENIPIKTVPKALLRSTANLTRNGELLLCFYSEFESK